MHVCMYVVFFNPVIPRPLGILTRAILSIPNPELEIGEIQDPENLLGTLYFESWNSACLDFFGWQGKVNRS